MVLEWKDLGQAEHFSICLHSAMHTACLLWLLLHLQTNSSTKVCKHPFAGANLGILLQDLCCLTWDVQFWLHGGVAAESPDAFTQEWNYVIHWDISRNRRGTSSHLGTWFILQNFPPIFSCLKKKKSRTLLAFRCNFYAPWSVSGWSSILCLQLNCRYKMFHH